VQEVFDAAEPAGPGANDPDQPPRAGVDAGFGSRVTSRGSEQSRCQALVSRGVGRRE
jgi:hypothetical protein